MENNLKKCLIVVDYQNDFVSGSLGFPGAESLEKGIIEKIRKYRESGGEVLFTFDTHYGDYMDTQEGKLLPVPHCIDGSEGHMLYGLVAEQMLETDRKFIKNTFGSDELYQYLKTQQFKNIELVGLVSNICVIANAILAKTAQPETPVIVDANLTASHDGKLHSAALDVMSGLQIEVIRKQCI